MLRNKHVEMPGRKHDNLPVARGAGALVRRAFGGRLHAARRARRRDRGGGWM